MYIWIVTSVLLKQTSRQCDMVVHPQMLRDGASRIFQSVVLQTSACCNVRFLSIAEIERYP